MVLFTILILSFRSAFSTFFMMLRPFGDLMLLFNLILTGIMSALRHLSENLLWFLKSTILHSNFSHQLNNLTFSRPYSALIQMNKVNNICLAITTAIDTTRHNICQKQQNTNKCQYYLEKIFFHTPFGCYKIVYVNIFHSPEEAML